MQSMPEVPGKEKCAANHKASTPDIHSMLGKNVTNKSKMILYIFNVINWTISASNYHHVADHS